MIVYKSFEDIPREDNSIVTIGTFDGIHLGHSEIIKNVVKESKNKKSRSVVVTFDPHPRLVVDQVDKIHILTTLEEKVRILEKLNVDILFVINFDKKFSLLTAYEFFTKMIYDVIGVRELVVGHDHSFGKNRSGNIEILKSLGQHLNFKVDVIEPISIENERISSTKIRESILSGDIEKANKFLGRYYSISGRVIEGDKRGREIGFPTANIGLPDENKLIPRNGVWFVDVFVEDSKYSGIMNIGKRPTFSSANDIYLEVNILDFRNNIYNRDIKIDFLHFHREERKFDSADELINQLNFDKQECYKYIKSN